MSDHNAPAAISWMKVPIVGMPGTECGRELVDGDTRRVDSFKAEFGECDEPGRWMVGRMFVCDEHARIVALAFGDDFDGIREAIRQQYGWETRPLDPDASDGWEQTREDVVLGCCPHGVDLDRDFCPEGCRV